MVKQVITDVFETLGGVAAGTGQQVVKSVKGGTEDIAKAVGVMPDDTPSFAGESQPNAQTDEQNKKIQSASNARSAAKYRQIQEEIKQIQLKRKQELPKQVTGKPGFSEEKAIKQLEEKPTFATATAGEKDKLPPLPAQRASKKAEAFRGASG